MHPNHQPVIDTNRLEQILPPARRALIAQVGRVAEARGLPLYLVGGFVRDLLLGLPPDDFDFFVEGDAPTLAHALVRELGGELTVHPAFRTATWTNPTGLTVDLATARTETYPHPAALPVVTPATIAEDLRRRDFTINALALRVAGDQFGELLDPHGGQADLTSKVVRVLHPRSFQDDPTRLFRAVRYEQRLGFALAPDTRALFPGAWAALAVLTGDRLRNEFELIFREANSTTMLTRLGELDILAHAHPALRWGPSQTRRAETIARVSASEIDSGYLALLLEGQPEPDVSAALTRLNVTRPVGVAVTEAVTLTPAWSRPSEAVLALDNLSEAGVVAASVLHEAARPLLVDYLARWRFIKPTLTGDDLVRRGLTPGPQFKKILWALRAARLDGEIDSDEAEQVLVERFLHG